VRILTPVSHTSVPGVHGAPGRLGHSGRERLRGPYHPASQYWPLQLTLLAILPALAAALLVSGWYTTRARAV
jgi:hypothetical protein